MKTVSVKKLKKHLKEAIKDCEEDLKFQKRNHEWEACISLEGKIYAYEFVMVDILSPTCNPELFDEEKK